MAITPALVAAPSANAAAPVPVTRIAGANRFGTAAAIAEKAFPAGASTVIVATGFNFPDALAGNYLAGVDHAPILLVNVDNVPSETSAALQTLKAKNVIILGQTQAVDQNVQNSLTSSGYTVTRIGGATRLETMQMIDEAPNATTIGVAANGKKTALLARADNFPDALGGGPVAFAKNFPVILTATNALSPQAQDVITKDGIQQVIILGGNLAISAATESQANAAGAATLYRANGVDRSDTSRLLAEYSLANLGFTTASYGIASGDQGYTGADALASGPFSGGIPQPTLVTNSINDPGTLVQYGAAHNATATNCYAFGGPIPLPDSTVNAVCNAAPAANQSYTVSPSTAASIPTGNVRQFTASGLGTAPVDIQLFDCTNVQQPASGPTTFTGTNPGGSGNFATAQTNHATVSVVNGVPAGATTGVTPTSGAISFSVTDATAGECVIPVVFQQGAAGPNQDRLPLNADGTPSTPFGTGGSTTFVTPATPGPIAGPTVSSANSSGFTAGGATYSYSAGDVYQLFTTGGSCTTTTAANFQSRITTGDTVSGTYNPPPAGPGSTFCLNDIAPTAPSVVNAVAPGTAPGTANAGMAGIQVNFSDSTTGTVASYNVYRATAIQPAITGQPVTCPTLTYAGTANSPQTPPAASSAYSKIGSVTDANKNDAGGTTPGTVTYSFLDGTATVPPTATPQNPSYCYVVTSVDQAGQEGNPSAVAGPAQATAATAAAGAPKFVGTTNSASAGGHSVTVTYNQAIVCASVDPLGSDYSVVYTDPSNVSHALTPAGAACKTGPTTDTQVVITLPLNSLGTAPNAGSVTVTAKTGADGNTVSNGASTPLFQPVGDSVFVSPIGA